MIIGNGYIDEQTRQTYLVLVNPDGTKRAPVTVADRAEAERLVYFHNRMYVKETFTHWLGQRKNVFDHVQDFNRSTIAEYHRRQINGYQHTALVQICQLIVDNEANINRVAPGIKSRHYKTYELLILPLFKFCRETKGVKHAR